MVRVIEIKSHDSAFLLALIDFLNNQEAEPHSTLVTVKEDISLEQFNNLMNNKVEKALENHFERRDNDSR